MRGHAVVRGFVAAAVAAAAVAAAPAGESVAGSGASAGETAEVPGDVIAPACVQPLTDVTLFSGMISSTTPVTVDLDALADEAYRAVFVETRTSAADALTLRAATEHGSVALVAAEADATRTALGLLPTSAPSFELSTDGGSAQVTVVATAFVSDQPCFTLTDVVPLLADVALVPGLATPVSLAGLAPGMALGTVAAALRLTAGDDAVTVNLVEDDATPSVVLSRRVDAGTAIEGVELIPPSDTGRYRLEVEGGTATVDLTPIGHFESATAYAHSATLLMDSAEGVGATGALQPGVRETVVLPPEVDGARSITLRASSIPDRGLLVDTLDRDLPGAGLLPPELVGPDISLYVWAAGEQRPTAPSVVFVAGELTSQLVVLPPGQARAVHVEIEGAEADLVLSFVGFSPTPPQLNETIGGVAHQPDSSELDAISATEDGSYAITEYSGGADVNEGDLIVLPPSEELPGGFLGRVEEVELLSATGEPAPTTALAFYLGRDLLAEAPPARRLHAAAAALPDVIPNADFDRMVGTSTDEPDALPADGALPADEEPATSDGTDYDPEGSAASPASGVARTTESGHGFEPSTAAQRTATAGALAGGANGRVPSSAKASCSVGSVTARASLQLASSVRLEGRWYWMGRKYLDFGFDGRVHGQISLTGSSAKCSGPAATVYGPRLPTLRFTIGAWPVWVVPELSTTFTTSGNMGGSFNAVANVNVGLRTGVRYEHGNFTPYFSTDAIGTASLTTRRGLSADFEIAPRLDVKIYNSAGPYVEVAPFASISADPFANPWWRTEVGIRGRVGVKFKLWFVDASFEAARKEFLRIPAGSAAASFPSPKIPAQTPPTGTVGKSYSHQLTASGASAPYRWYLTQGRLPAGLSLSSSGRISGTPPSSGASWIRVMVRDAGGFDSAGRNILVRVGNAPIPPTPDPDPPPTTADRVTASKGASAQGRPGCSVSACRYVTVGMTGFSANQSVTIECWSSVGHIYTYNTKVGSTGSGTSSVCYFGYPGEDVWAKVNGITSKKVRW
jgi:hypothetical protein